MPAAESVLVAMEFTMASGPHECGNNREHRLERGMARLTVREDKAEHHYCLECARSFLAQGVEQLQVLLAGANRLAAN